MFRRKKIEPITIDWEKNFALISLDYLLGHYPPGVQDQSWNWGSVQHYFLKKEKDRLSRLCYSIARIGMTEPILLSERPGVSYVEDGHHRVVCAKLLGLSHVPVVFAYRGSDKIAREKKAILNVNTAGIPLQDPF